ncbi:MAG: ATPase [Synergistaceae bacterium]|nr:ATPase [Synergistota bacterium]NLM71443.1 ATPase [Synergistaceae bacterium]
MNLSTVLIELLDASDEAAAGVEAARRKASEMLRESRERLAADRETRLTAARTQAKTIVESARQSAELEAAQIAEMGARGRAGMKERFAQSAPEIVRSLTLEVAARYGGVKEE